MPHAAAKLLRRVHHLLDRGRFERELDEEMTAHREMMQSERRAAFGNSQRFHDQSRDLWGWLWFDHLRQDLLYALRGFTRDRRFTLSGAGAICLAVGAATAVFSVVDRSLFRALPYTQGDRLVSVSMTIPHLGLGEIMFNGAYHEWRAAQHAVDLTSWSGVADCDLGGDAPRRLNCARAEASFLPTLGVRPLLGRNFSVEEDQRGAEPVALLSYSLWRNSFGADPAIPGKKIVLDGMPARIVGVLPAGFELPDLVPADLLVPQRLPLRNARNYEIASIGRLAPGQTAASAAAALAGPFETFRLDFDRRVGGNFTHAMRLIVEPLRDRQVRQYRLALWMLLGAVAAFVLIACANVANLLLARSAGRRQEFAIRAALGGSRRRLLAQLLTESTLLGLAGGAAGCGLAWGLLRAFLAIAPDGALRLRDAALDARVLSFAVLLSLGAALIFGLAPSVHRLSTEALGQQRATGPRRGARGSRLRQALITAQLAISLVLLAGAGLLLMSLWHLQNTPLGLNRERVVTASFTLPAYRYGQALHPTGWSDRTFQFYNQVEARLKEAPGVVAEAITDSLPPAPDPRTYPYVALARPGGRVTDPGMSGSVKWRYVTPGYFEALGIPLRRGRDFSEADRAQGPGSVIVNQTLARRLWGDSDPVGKRMGRYFTVIGVAADVRNAGLDRPADPEFYQVREATGEGISGSGDDAWWRRATVIVRSNLGERDAAALLRAAIRDVDSSVPVEIRTMEAQVDAFLARPRFETTLLVLFALTGLMLAAIGLYGLISFLATERTHEIGVRVALGATPPEIARLVVSDGARWTLAGAILGLAASGGLLRFLRGLLYDTGVFDPRVLAAAVALLAAVAIASAWLPARRASRMDPLAALRHD